MTLIISLTCGILGNAWYLRHAQAEIEAVKRTTRSHLERINALQSRGSTSAVAVLVFVLTSLAVTVPALLAVDAFFGIL